MKKPGMRGSLTMGKMQTRVEKGSLEGLETPETRGRFCDDGSKVCSSAGHKAGGRGS